MNIKKGKSCTFLLKCFLILLILNSFYYKSSTPKNLLNKNIFDTVCINVKSFIFSLPFPSHIK